MPVNVIAFITVRNHRSAFNTVENLQAVVSRGVIFKHSGGLPPKPSKPPPTVVLEVLEVGYPVESNLVPDRKR